MDQAVIERLKNMGLKLSWSPQWELKGVHWLLEGVWFILVLDADGGYWSVVPERSADQQGAKSGPDGGLLGKEKPEELARVLREAGLDVRLFKMEEKAHLSAKTTTGR